MTHIYSFSFSLMIFLIWDCLEIQKKLDLIQEEEEEEDSFFSCAFEQKYGGGL